MASTDAEEQDQELESLKAIYGDDLDVFAAERVVELHIPSRDGAAAVARATLPADYPSASPPVVELLAPRLPAAEIAAAAADLSDLFVPGEVVLFAWLEAARERVAAALEAAEAAEALAAGVGRLGVGIGGDGGGSSGGESGSDAGDDSEEEEPGAEEAAIAAAAQARERRAAAAHATTSGGAAAAANDDDAALAAAVAARIVSGDPYTERRSTFQAHACRVTDPREVGAVVAALLANSKIAAATHPAIMAYRIRHPTRPGVYYMDSDDDGEAAAGGRLLKLLQLAGAEDVAVVVTRWFGGVLLGPSRFALINNVARALLVREGFIAAPAAAAAAAGGGKEGGGGGGKKKKGR